MKDEQDSGSWTAPSPASPSVPSEWSPPASSLPAPPPAPVSPSDAAATVSTGPIEASVSKRPSWVGRAAALAAAALLVGGGGFLAINAGANDAGADSPADALAGAFEALGNQDLLGAAEFVEPVERETMIDAGFHLVEELIRLDVFDSSLDLSSVEGIDFEINYADLTVVELTPDLAQIYVDNGTITTSVDGARAPLGALITDRVDEEDLAVIESTSADLPERGTPIVAVRRDGRWYLSLWYSVAENARLAMGEPLPDPDERIEPIGGDTPERTIENLVAAAALGDLTTSIALLDPEEAGVLYDYAPLFIEDAQRGVDEGLAGLREEGWAWEVTSLELQSNITGSTASVTVDEFSFVAADQQGSTLEFTFTPTTFDLYFEGDDMVIDVQAEDDCTTIAVEDNSSRESETFCQDDLLNSFGLGGLASTGLTGMQAGSIEIVLHEVDGRWYISPIRSGTRAMFMVLEEFDAETVAETVDAFAEMMSDPFGSGSFDSLIVPELSTDDSGVIPFPLEPVLPRDLIPNVGSVDWSRPVFDEIWDEWLSSANPSDFQRGAVAGITSPDDEYFEVVVLAGIPLAADADLAALLNGSAVEWNDRLFVEGESVFGPFVASRYNDGFILVGDYGASVLSEGARLLLDEALYS